MNHCAFCLDMHTADARKQGISEQKLALLPAWEEAGDVFTEQEQAALALTEEMTDLTRRHVSDEVYERAAAAFTERELGQVIAMALTINAWNRIGVTDAPARCRGANTVEGCRPGPVRRSSSTATRSTSCTGRVLIRARWRSGCG